MSIRKVRGGYVVVSKDGKRLSKVHKDRKSALKRLRQVEHYKKAKKR